MLSWFGAGWPVVGQLGKLVIVLVMERQWRPGVLFETGGMPSSHAALVSGMAAGVSWEVDFDQPLFALACYDASGVRRAAGLQAEQLNTLAPSPDHCPPPEPLNNPSFG